MSRIGAIIVSRLDSRRLPGKVLHRVGGRPLIDFVLQRCRRIAALDGNIVLATSDRTVDDPLEHFAKVAGMAVFRGATEDVAGRVLQCATQFEYQYFLRVNGDSPFLEPALVEQALAELHDGVDLITNLQPRSFPYGVSVEIVKTAVFAKAYEKMESPEQREHVTKYLYENLRQYKYYNIKCPYGDYSRTRMTVDTQDDMDWFRQIVTQFAGAIDNLNYMEVVQLQEKEAEVR